MQTSIFTVRNILWTIGVFLIAWLVFWLVADLLIALSLDPTVAVGTVLHRVEVVLAALCAIAYFARSKF